MKMRKGKWLVWLWTALLCIASVASVYGAQPDASDEHRIYDMAGLFRDSRLAQWEEKIGEYRKQYHLDLVVVTTEDAGGKTSTEYADDFYDEGGYGEGSQKDGILFLIDMDNRELYFSTSGKAVRIFTDDRIESMLDDVYEGASQGNYEDCVDSFLSDAEYYCRAGIPGGQYNYDTETGKVSVYRSIRWYEALLAVGISGFVAGTACLGVKRRYGMEENDAQVRNLNMAYRADAKFLYDIETDKFVNRFVTSRRIPRSTGGRGGGGHFSSGRSSTHTSSGGHSHGGGGRKF